MIASAYLALPSAFLLIVFAIGELSVPKIRKRNVLLAVAFVAFAFTLVRAFLLLRGWMIYIPHLYETALPLNFFLGPVVRTYMREALGLTAAGGASKNNKQKIETQRLWPHLIPGLIVCGILIPNVLQPAAVKLERIAAFLEYMRTGAPIHDPFALILPLGILHVATYLGLIMRDMVLLLSVQSLRHEGTVRAFLSIAGIALLSSLIAIAGIATARREFIEFSISLLAVIPPLLYIFQRRFPQFFNDLEALLKRERESARYQRSQLEGVNLADLEARLERLMETERLYTRDDLSLPALAELLGTTPHQLSEYFNHIRNVNFAGYINGRRIAAACELLLGDPSRTVLSLPYEVGFNSKSAFNEAFARHAGVSPTRFRKSGGRPGA